MDQERSELEKRDYDTEAVDADTETSEDAEQIRRQIEETRAEMSETIDAIEDKFDVSRITEQVKDEVTEHISDAYETAKDSVYEATIGKAGEVMKSVGKEAGKMTEAMGDAGSYIVRGAKHNPLPLALIGLGIGLLIFQGNGSSSSKKVRRNTGNGSPGNSTANRAKGLVGGAADSVGDAANAVYDKAGNLVSQTGEQISHAGQYARELTHDAYERYEEVYESNPLVVGAVAFGLGAAVALAIPSTQYENELMGETKENLINSAGDMAQNAISKAKDAVGDVAETARQKAAG